MSSKTKSISSVNLTQWQMSASVINLHILFSEISGPTEMEFHMEHALDYGPTLDKTTFHANQTSICVDPHQN